MQTLRFNPFGQIHKGLRALLYDTALLLQHTNFASEDETDVAIERVQLVNSLFEHHAQVEDSQIFPLIEAYEPALVADFEAQHQKDHQLSEALEQSLQCFAQTNTPEQNMLAGNNLLQRFHAFLAFNVEHMNGEETVVNNCLWRYYSDAELLQKVQEISSAIPPEQNRHFVYWMLKGMATQEIINWYNAVKGSAPLSVFHFFCDLAEEALPGRRWNEVKEALQEEALLA